MNLLVSSQRIVPCIFGQDSRFINHFPRVAKHSYIWKNAREYSWTVDSRQMQKLASQKLDILDIGSGTPALTHSYLQKPNVLHLDISKKAFCLELTADVHHLPFRDSTFRIVYASHVLEHLEAPLDAVEEMKRVSKKYVIIKVPNGAFYKRNPEASGHIFSWNKFTFRNLLARFFDAVEIRESVRSYNPNASPFQKRIRTLKYLATSWFYSFNELTAVCVKGLFSANRKG